MLASSSSFFPSEILHDWQASSRRRCSVSIVFLTLLIENYAEIKLTSQIFVRIYEGDLLVSCIFVC